MKEKQRCLVESPIVCLLFGCAAGAISLGGGGVCAFGLLEIMAGRKPQFPLGQVLSIFAGGTVIGLVLAPAFALTPDLGHGGGARRGVLFGLTLFGLLLAAVAPLVSKQTDETVLWIAAPGAIFAAIALIGYGTMLGTAVEELDRPVPAQVNPKRRGRGASGLMDGRRRASAAFPFCPTNN